MSDVLWPTLRSFSWWAPFHHHDYIWALVLHSLTLLNDVIYATHHEQISSKSKRESIKPNWTHIRNNKQGHHQTAMNVIVELNNVIRNCCYFIDIIIWCHVRWHHQQRKLYTWSSASDFIDCYIIYAVILLSISIRPI